jgi:hypothetical protein
MNSDVHSSDELKKGRLFGLCRKQFRPGQPVLFAGVLLLALKLSAAPPIVIEAESGDLTPPFSKSGTTVVYHANSPTNSGRAVYRFDVPEAGTFALRSVMSGTEGTSHTLYLSIDKDDPEMADRWKFTANPKFQTNWVRFDSQTNRFGPPGRPTGVFLEKGSHTLIIRGNEADLKIDRFEVCRVPAPPKEVGLKVQTEKTP